MKQTSNISDQFNRIKQKLSTKRVSSIRQILAVIIIVLSITNLLTFRKVASLSTELSELTAQKSDLTGKLTEINKSYDELKNQDQVKINTDLKAELGNIKATYGKVVTSYEDLLKLKEKSEDTGELDKLFTDALVLLTKEDYSLASTKLTDLQNGISSEEAKIAATFIIPASVPENNTPPGSGYNRQSVNTDAGTFLVSIISADLSSTRVIVDTASDSDCSDNCPVLPLATYISRNNAYAGVNGSYFCPASYPSCAGKTNTFDLLVMNYKKTYFNSDNNVYSNNPAVIFGDGYIRFVSAVSQWGRDTSPNGVLSNYPLLVQGGNITFGGDDDPKKGSKGARSFVANKSNTVYIGVVHNATVAESARVMQALGMENALNLDDGGSTALWSGGYKVGPGRDLPNVILFVRK
ncbi:MAG: hypothetical protein UT61_C0012G0003 [Candidatus Woesebacteria bacterium GW2011_GWA1_39_8]|uniref:Phosphodiester glycosidase domain-containing protein n=1 Tax=Candidatus Woesebacteria bacterium GW2011_GWA1_39_8 TaxID=1618552 RepID=A0A0G0PQH0_9BACT|nr:MAG: hypothetical protein UT61_C0012G0003 [Candidatus Woesebacteria bacterium GW2011_GWA1_39_8]